MKWYLAFAASLCCSSAFATPPSYYAPVSQPAAPAKELPAPASKQEPTANLERAFGMDRPPQADAAQARHPLAPLQAAKLRPITAMTTMTRPPEGALPPNYAAAAFDDAGEQVHGIGYQRTHDMVAYQWEAPGICHRPLYFEEINLERYGYHYGPILQPAISGAHFFTRFPIMPYLVALDHPHECFYTLGHYRPGSHAPFRTHYVPIYPWPTLVEAAAITGVFYLFP